MKRSWRAALPILAVAAALLGGCDGEKAPILAPLHAAPVAVAPGTPAPVQGAKRGAVVIALREGRKTIPAFVVDLVRGIDPKGADRVLEGIAYHLARAPTDETRPEALAIVFNLGDERWRATLDYVRSASIPPTDSADRLWRAVVERPEERTPIFVDLSPRGYRVIALHPKNAAKSGSIHAAAILSGDDWRGDVTLLGATLPPSVVEPRKDMPAVGTEEKRPGAQDGGQ